MEKLMSDYGRFESTVTAIRSGASSAQLLGKGAEATVWGANVDNEPYAIKFMNEYSIRGRKRDTAGAARSKAEIAIRGSGIRGLEQIRAVSPEDGVAIYEYAKGKVVSELTSDDIENITDKQVVALCQTVELATEAGIMFDGWNREGDNAFYCPERGFTFIDYWALNSTIGAEKNMRFAMYSLGAAGIVLAARADMVLNLANNRGK